MIRIRKDLSLRELRFFAGLVLPAFWGLVAWMLHTRAGWSRAALAIAAIAALVAVVGLARPLWMRPIYLGMVYAVFPIGWLVSHILLMVVYYLVLTPIGALLRLTGYDAMKRSFDDASSTYWIDKEEKTGVEDYFRQF